MRESRRQSSSTRSRLRRQAAALFGGLSILILARAVGNIRDTEWAEGIRAGEQGAMREVSTMSP